MSIPSSNPLLGNPAIFSGTHAPLGSVTPPPLLGSGTGGAWGGVSLESEEKEDVGIFAEAQMVGEDMEDDPWAGHKCEEYGVLASLGIVAASKGNGPVHWGASEQMTEQFSNLVADCMLYGVEVRALPPEQIWDYRDEKMNIYDLVTSTHQVEHLPRDYPMVLILEYPRHQQECYTSWRRLHAEGYKTTLCLIENVTGQQIEPGSLWAEVLYCRARNGPFASHIVTRGFLETPHPMRFWQEGVQPRQ